MKVYYRVLSADETEGSIVVRYFTDFLTEEELVISKDIDGDTIYNANGYPERCRTDYILSFQDNLNPTEEDVKKLIEMHAPIQWFTIQENIKSNLFYSIENVMPFVNQKNEFEANTIVNPAQTFEVVNDVFITGNLTVTGIITSNTL